MAKQDPAAGRAAVEAYLSDQPPGNRAALEDLRARVARLAPDATEAISYGMPAFCYHGKFLVSYAGWARHCAFYPLTGATTAAHAAELAGLSYAKGTIRFTPPQRLSDDLLSAIVHERMAAIDAGGR
ncbi:MAG TPA: DUF1801 domain-containing protein [Candidatus Limnocylindrales bacterium]|nr:DUF1801 domain-containing protein [Candidatus Limnocylindrales bacterium]